MHGGGPGRQQPIPRHAEKNARLAHLKNQQHRRGGQQRPHRNDHHRPIQAQAAERGGQRFGGVQFGRRQHAGQHDGDRDINDRAKAQAAEDADGHVTLRVAGFFRRR